MKFNVVNALEKTNHVVGLVAGISFGISVIVACAKFTRHDVKILLGIARSSSEEKTVEEKPAPKKSAPKKAAPKASEPAPKAE